MLEATVDREEFDGYCDSIRTLQADWDCGFSSKLGSGCGIGVLDSQELSYCLILILL